jgi:hypothetical protein
VEPGLVDNKKLHSVNLLAEEEAAIWIAGPEAISKVIGRLHKKPWCRHSPSSFL